MKDFKQEWHIIILHTNKNENVSQHAWTRMDSRGESGKAEITRILLD